MNKKAGIFFSITCLALLLAGCAPQADTGSETGRAVITLTDAAADMGAVTKIDVTINSVQAHSTTEGWVELSSETQTHDLLELKAQGSQALLADAQLAQGTYNQIRLDISQVTVTDADGEHDAKLPSETLRINGELVIDANTTATATFDFIADESLHITGNGEYILAPVITLETRTGADVDVNTNNRVEIRGGTVRTNVTVGTDAQGNVGVGIRLPAQAQVSVDARGRIMIGSSSGDSMNTNGSTNAAVNIGN